MNQPLRPPAGRPAHTWPVALGIGWLLLLLAASKDGGNASFISVVIVLGSATNLLGLLIALLRRRWAVAGWYGLALLVVLGCGALALATVEVPLYQDE
jgi:hypothetical protein